MLERRLFRRKSTGEVIDPDWLQFSFPTWWHYDVLRGLDYLRDAGVDARRARRRGDPGRRGATAIPTVGGRSRTSTRARPTSRWTDGEGQPSRWNTLRALRVLDWFATI